jgi:hypothetical protein
MSEEQQATDFIECANRISTAMNECMESGNGLALVCVVAVQVATDYMRCAYTDKQHVLDEFSDLIHRRLNEPMPEIEMVN